MNRLNVERTIALVAAIFLFFFILFGARLACAQAGGYIQSGRTETSTFGRYVTMWNATGTEILDGTLVMVDTLAATTGPQIPLGKGFKTWNATPGQTYRVVGILIGNCPSYDKCRVLVDGGHPNALMDATALTGWARLRPSLSTAGALGAWADADSANSYKVMVGRFLRYKDGTSLRGYVDVDFGATPKR